MGGRPLGTKGQDTDVAGTEAADAVLEETPEDEDGNAEVERGPVP